MQNTHICWIKGLPARRIDSETLDFSKIWWIVKIVVYFQDKSIYSHLYKKNSTTDIYREMCLEKLVRNI